MTSLTIGLAACSDGQGQAIDAGVGSRCAAGASGPAITVDGASDLGALRSLQGFLNGINPAPGNAERFDDAVVGALRPAFWRFGTGSDVVFDKIARFGATLTYVVSDGYADSRGGYDLARPWEDWTGYEAFVTAAARANLTAGRPIRYFDVWGEPQGGTPWRGSYDQLVELFARTIAAVRAVDPAVKVIGPSYDDFLGTFDGHSFGDLIVELDRRFQRRLDGISWHELGNQPVEDVPRHADLLRQGLASALPGYAPELHVNEYAGPTQHLLPGWAVGWLHYLTVADVDVASRACWNVGDEGWSDCWAGLDGLLRPDNRTPQHTYWAHRYYAELVGQVHLSTTATDPHVVGLAVRVPATGVLRVLTGRFVATPPGPSAAVTLRVTGLPDGISVDVATFEISSAGVPGPLAAPISAGSCRATATGGQVEVGVPTYADGAAIYFELTPAP